MYVKITYIFDVEFTSKTLDSVDSRDLAALVKQDWSDDRLGEPAAPKRRRMGERTVFTLTPLIFPSLRVSWDEERALSRLRDRG